MGTQFSQSYENIPRNWVGKSKTLEPNVQSETKEQSRAEQSRAERARERERERERESPLCSIAYIGPVGGVSSS